MLGIDIFAWKERLLPSPDGPADDRGRMRAVANNLILHLHPTKVPVKALRFTYTWGLGGLSATLATLLVITGVLLMFRYDASIDKAYSSIQYLETQVALGSLVRAIHHWSANLLIVTVFLHLLRVFYTAGFKNGRGANWAIGIVLLLIVITFNFTGYLLPWDQLAYWAVTVGTSLLSYIPLVGAAMSDFLLAGPEVGQGALRNFYAIHVAVLPAVLVMLMSYHFWKVRKDGGISQPMTGEKERVEKVTTIPHLVRVELAAATALIASVVIGAMLLPAPLESLADPSHPTNPAKAAWYFLGLQELLLHMHPLAAMVLAGVVLAGMIFLPRLDRKGDDIGLYFRSAVGRRTALTGAILSFIHIPLLVIVDEYWLDLPAAFPMLPVIISNGLIPLILSLGFLGAIYAGFRKLDAKTTHSEALVGLFTYMVVSLIILTVIGIFFRGPGMSLVWPW